MLLVIIIQCIYSKKGLVTEMVIPNYQSLFFKLTQLAQLSQKDLGKPRLIVKMCAQIPCTDHVPSLHVVQPHAHIPQIRCYDPQLQYVCLYLTPYTRN